MSLFLRRSVFALSKVPIANMGGVGCVRMYTTAKNTHKASQFGYHPEVEVGDLVTYTDIPGSTAAGYIQKIYSDSGKQAPKDSMKVEIQDYHTKKVAHTELKNVQSVARKHDTPHSAAKPAATAHTAHTPASAHTTHTPASAHTAHTAQKATTTTVHPPPKGSAATTTHTASTSNMTAEMAKAQVAQQHLKESAQKVKEQVNSETSPLNVDFAVGDIVRYRVGQNFTAGCVLEVVYNTTHDEQGNFHGATKENPMAKLENLWTKNITYHHLNVLEHVKRARDVTPGRFAEQQYAVHNAKQ